MNCRQCGQKLGLVGRLRNNPFCSKECKDAFELEEVRLTEQIVEELRSKARPYETKEKDKDKKPRRGRSAPEPVEPVAVAAERAAPEPVEEAEDDTPELEMWPFLDQEQAEPANWKSVAIAPVQAVIAKKGKVAWKDLAQQVEGRLSGSAMAAAELAQLGRAIPAESGQVGAYLVAERRPVLAPEIRPPRLKVVLCLAGLQAPVAPEFRPPAFVLPDIPPLLDAPIVQQASYPTRPAALLATRGLPLPGQLPALPVPPPEINEAVPPGATWAAPQDAWDVFPQEVTWTDVALETIRLSVVLDPYDIHPSGGAPSRLAQRSPAQATPASPAPPGVRGPRPAAAPGIPASAPPAFRPGAPPPAMGHPHVSAAPPRPAYAGQPAYSEQPAYTGQPPYVDAGVEAPPPPPSWTRHLVHSTGWGQGPAYPVAPPQRRPATAAGPLPSHMPVMSLADLFIPEFAPALLNWPRVQKPESILHAESAAPAPPLGTRRPHFPLLSWTASEPKPEAAVALGLGASAPPLDAGSVQPARDLALNQLKTLKRRWPVHDWSESDPQPEAAVSLPILIERSAPHAGMPVWTTPPALAPAGRGPCLPSPRWNALDAHPSPGQPVAVPAAPRNGVARTNLAGAKPRLTCSVPAQVPRRESFVWQRPGFHPRVLRPHVRVSALDAGMGEMVAPATI
jgi:hypothetical protein